MNIASAEQYQTESKWIYRFPFILQDPEYGRIEWQVEPVYYGERIDRLIISTRQTKDKRYDDQVFELECYAENLSSHGDHPYFAGVWFVGKCKEHRTLFFRSYPPDGMSVLIVDLGSSIGLGYE